MTDKPWNDMTRLERGQAMARLFAALPGPDAPPVRLHPNARGWFVAKASRLATEPYCGPSCDTAGEPAGVVWLSLDDATEHAARLRDCNPVGFTVQPYMGRP